MPHFAAATRFVSSALGGFLRNKKMAPKTNQAKKNRIRVTTPTMSVFIASPEIDTKKSVGRLQVCRHWRVLAISLAPPLWLYASLNARRGIFQLLDANRRTTSGT